MKLFVMRGNAALVFERGAPLRELEFSLNIFEKVTPPLVSAIPCHP